LPDGPNRSPKGLRIMGSAFMHIVQGGPHALMVQEMDGAKRAAQNNCDLRGRGREKRTGIIARRENCEIRMD